MSDPRDDREGLSDDDPRFAFLKRLASEGAPARPDDMNDDDGNVDIYALDVDSSLEDEVEPDASEEPLVVIDWEDPDEFTEFYIDDEGSDETSVEAITYEPPLPSPAFPPDIAERIRQRAWAEYADGLRSQNGDGSRNKKRRRTDRSSGLWPCLEILGCLGLLTAINLWLSPDDLGFRRLELNPYVIPVVLLGVRYGTAAGLAAGLLSALWIGVASRRADLEDGSLVLPGLLVVLGTLTGALSRSQGRRLMFFRDLVRRLRKNAERARRTLSATAAVIRDLQSQIESESVSAAALYRMSRGMGSEDPREIYESLLRILSGDLGAQRLAVFERQGDEFVLRSSTDKRTLPKPFPQTLSTKWGLAEMSLRLGRAVSAFDSEATAQDRPLPDTCVLAGPIHSGGAVRALVVVYDLDLLSFSPSTLTRFSALLDWANESLARASRLRQPREGSGSPSWFDPATGACRLPSFVDFLKREENRARRACRVFRVLEVRIGSYEELLPARRRAARELIARTLFAYTRDFDTIGVTAEENAFAVLLPDFESSDVRALGDRLRNAVGRAWPGESLDLSFRFLDPDEFSSQAQVSLWPVEARAA